ncbi:MFS transporter [Sinorhizobium medicae]|uniref:MFS transporter n=1 Tax=Sinorhizobium medicae TaxID=110321 RepID=A0A6G1WMM2_9HYPH|nr:MFS transporter [Sinorhizobium medicae]MDX0429857.1 MFS transporter [Sinorhizobium medicae]MDX0449769.1 MFS transporter [Sinorhizobium medicae]MDX0461345.1 MFS transporter [Sinorhizobium medicae]MDX0498829.1 MFS transporter [Sinorhizobium medicae]MDX0505119.1 MFS transporter [Sinorhizobium medicae]
MPSSLLIAMRNPVIRTSMFAIVLFGFSGAATSPYQSVVGITELGLSDGLYSALIFAAALVNVALSVTIGIVADRVGNYRTLMLAVILCGVAGYGAVYLLPTKLSFVLAALILLPAYGALNPLLFAYVRTAAKDMGGRHAAAVNSAIRAAISLSWVLVPGLVGLVLSAHGSMLPAYLLASLGCLANFVLVLRRLPPKAAVDQALGKRLSFLASFGEILSLRVVLRLLAIALISSTLHVNAAVLPLIVTGAVGGDVGDIGIIVGIVALLEVIFILVWGRIQDSLSHINALALGTAIYVVNMALLGLSAERWHIYALTLVSAFGAAALISIPITYLQELIADRPGLGSSLISVNIFLGGGLGAALFALGTRISDYSGTALLSSLAGVAGLSLLLFLDGGRGKASAL